MPSLANRVLSTRRPKGGRLLIVLLLVVVGITLTIGGIYGVLRQDLRADTHEQLELIAAYKAEEIQGWLRERRGALEALAVSQTFHTILQKMLNGVDASEQSTSEQALRARLEHLRESHHFRSVLLLDTRGQPLLSVGEAEPPGEDRHLTERARTPGVQLDDFHRQPNGAIALGLFTAIALPTPAAQPVLYAHIDPQDFLYPLIQRWPTSSPSGETLLVRREGERVLFLNELRHRARTALQLTHPLDAPELPAAQGLRGRKGVVEGSDYRGVPVLAVLTPLEGTPWLMVTKLDSHEAYATLRQVTRLSALMLSGVLSAAGLLLWQWWRGQHAAQRAERLARDLQQQRLAERFDFLTRYANDAILLFDAGGRVQEANERALALYGYSREDFLDLRLEDLRAPGETERLAPSWEQLVQHPSLVYEGLHRRCDGTPFPVECSVRRLEHQGEVLYQEIVRDIGERRAAERHIARLSRLHRLRARIDAAIVRSPSMSKVWQEACHLIVEDGDFQQVWMGRLEPESGRLVALTEPDLGDPCCATQPALSEVQRLLGQDLQAAHEGRVLVCNAVRSDPRTSPWSAYLLEAGIEACVLLPVPSQQDTQTVLVVESGEPGRFDAESVALLEDLANDLGLALDNFATRHRAEQAEAALRRFELLARHSRDIILFLRRDDGQLLEANEAALQAYGYDREEFLSLTIHDLRVPQTQPMTLSEMAQADTHGLLFETLHRRRDGSTFFAEVSSQGALIGETETLISVIRDVSERKSAEQALRLSEARFAQAFSANPAALTLSRFADGLILDVNETWLTLFGFRREELIGHSSLSLSVWPSTQERARFMQELAREGSVRDREQTLLTRSGEPMIFLLSGDRLTIGDEDLVLLTWLDITARKHAEQALQESEQRYRTVGEAIPYGVWTTDPTGRCTYASQSFLEMVGMTLQEVQEFGWLHLLPPEDVEPTKTHWLRCIQSGEDFEQEHHFRDRDGAWRHVLAIGRPVHDGAAIESWVGINLDITARKDMEEALREAHDTREAILQGMTEGLVIATPEGMVLDMNPAAQRLHGFTHQGEALHALAEFPNIFEVCDLAGELQPPESWPLSRACRGEIFSHHELWVRRHDTGQSFIGSYGGTPVRDVTGRLRLGIVTIHDITEQKRAEERIRQLAFYDPLTGLPNRRLLEERLATALTRAKRQQECLAVIVLDLDFFKQINDSLGHAAGDALLVEVARRMSACVRTVDTVARPGGDEFMLILPETGTEGTAHLAAKLIARLNAPLHLEGQELSISCSLGISLFPDHGTEASTLISCADTAMYRAKQSGRNRYQFFTEDMQREARRAITLEQQLRAVLAGEGLCLHYQPQVTLASGRAIGLEALVRWAHPTHGLLGADAFVPLAERNGLIEDLGAWVLRAVGAQLSAWSRARLPLLPVAVNLSAQQFRHSERRRALIAQLNTLLADGTLDPSLIELEITENSLLEETDETLETLQALRTLGVRLTLDDFGTGYSSLHYLNAFPVCCLKIDQSFVRAAPEQPRQAAIVQTILALGRHLDFSVIAEGVETAAQLTQLRRLGCEQAQGYYFSRPLPAREVEEWLRRAV
ncbi:diguanylate cyclase/phosphodiesterase with PAS/PAC and GAF sensor(s) [Thiorhodococcus drewsii AZ1]|uniref:Diguanylate cyclase/phosphodiesterase with PAS/PAC and GAF sensor(S) n=1 Tax=Thiorhodococcus drewsii AZ1 TaxID=765913 RepID=G2E5N9_9GAMM|nr:PAS domain S-box protein [Thiorhodococcus drewsii]EGV28610.1 diguanylate cyclase/phosphodiesterase with PAS/PAC and GAF sensor(s) [Thiorhodococcus drewsii AZ1]